eukprot:273620_1
MVNNVHWILFIVISTISWLILFPLVICYAFKLWKYKNIDIVTMRQPSLTLTFAITGTALILLSRTYIALIQLLEHESFHLGILTDYIIRDIANSITYIYIALFDQILWISWFNWIKSLQLLKKKWKGHLHLIEILNKDNVSTKLHLHWTLKYGKHLTNKKSLFIVALLFWILCVLVLIALPNRTIWQQLAQLILGLIVILPSIILGYKSSKLFDSLGMKKQLSTVCIIFVVALILIGIITVTIPVKHIQYKTNIVYAIITWSLLSISFRMCYIEQLEQHINKIFPSDSNWRLRTSTLDTPTTENPNLNTEMSQTSCKLGYKDVWNNKQLFELFANHCTKEYSIETVLFLLEFEQCKQLIIRSHEDLIEDIDERKDFVDRLNKSQKQFTNVFVISSDILKLKDDITLQLTDSVKLLKYLFDNYIDEDSYDVINISGKMRNKIYGVFNKHKLLQQKNKKTRKQPLPLVVIHSFQKGINGRSRGASHASAVSNTTAIMISDIIEAFDAVSEELFMLLRKDSWYRFKQTDMYAQFIQEE